MSRAVWLSVFLFAGVAFALLQTNTCTPKGNARLEVLELHPGSFQNPNLIEGFQPDQIWHDVLFPESETVGVLWARPQDPTASAEVHHDGVPVPFTWDGMALLDVPLGSSEVTIKVSVDTGGTSPYSWTYRVRIDRRDLCEEGVCDDQGGCILDATCDPFTGACQGTTAEDGTPCADGRGRCYGGQCNYVPVSVSIGPKEVVFDWSADSCEQVEPEALDIPDANAQAVRTESGELVLFSGSHYVSRGPTFETLQRVCDPVFVGAFDDAPESYENGEWLWTPYRQESTWHMLIHNEFHDAVSPTCDVGNPWPGNPCWYNSIAYAVSTDDAHSFLKPSPPAHVVAPAPVVWEPPFTSPPPGSTAMEGYFLPSNIVHAPDGYYYSMIRHFHLKLSYIGGFCPIRTAMLGDPQSWRAWDGTGFGLKMESPYVTGEPVPACTWVKTNLTSPNTSLTYNTYLQRYMLVGQTQDYDTGVCRSGIWFSLSTDLIHWSDRQMLSSIITVCNDPSPEHLEPVWVLYPSIIDHADTTTNFERPGRAPYLYYTRMNGGLQDPWSLDRDLVRVPLTFTRSEDLFACTEQGIRDAIAQGGGPHLFDCDGPTTVFTEAEIIIGNDVILDGKGNLTVDANQAHRVFSIPEGVTAELIGFTVTGGSTAEAGGGILNEGTFSLAASTITGNHADIGGGIRNFETGTLVVTDSSVLENTAVRWGGGIHSVGRADVVDTTVSGNAAELGGGGLTNFTATMVVAGCTVADNSANGILNFGGDLTVINTAVSGNESGYDGGGISNVESGTTALHNTTVSSNTAANDGGGITNRVGGTVTLTGSTVEDNTATNEGGGIHNVGMMTVASQSTGIATLNYTTISGNEAGTFGGGIRNYGVMQVSETTVSNNSANGAAGISNSTNGTMTIDGSTVHGNTASSGDGGIGNFQGTITVTNTTVSGNESAGIRCGISNFESGSVMLVNTTVSGNIASGGVTGVWNFASLSTRNTIIDGGCGTVPSTLPIDSLGGNIESPGNTCGLNPGGTDQVSVSELALNLGPLQDNGGPTETHALDSGSVAIDQIPAVDCVDADGEPLTTDQRGEPRDSMCDVGAFEVQP